MGRFCLFYTLFTYGARCLDKLEVQDRRGHLGQGDLHYEHG